MADIGEQKKMRSKKGFIFTILALVIISYMILEFNIYLRAFQMREEGEPSRLRALVLGEIGSKITLEAMTEVSEIVAYNALYALTKHAADTRTAIEDPKAAIADLMVKGSGGGASVENTKTLNYWSGSMANISSKMGFGLSMTYEDFIVDQPDPWTVQIRFTYSYRLADTATNTRIVSPSRNVSVNVSIVGFEDPYLARKFSVTRNILPAPGGFANNWTSVIADTFHGRGWFYGEIFRGRCLASDEFEQLNDGLKFNESNKKKILCTTQIALARTYAEMFGAAIIFDPAYAQLEADEFTEFTVPVLARRTDPPSLPAAVLMLSKNDTNLTTSIDNKIYNVENLRRAAMCGYYMTNNAASQNGYTFLDRLSDVRTSGPNSIETFAIGIWAPDSRDLAKNSSSIDWAYWSLDPSLRLGNKTMGMPGCRWSDMCNDSSPILRFRIDSRHIAMYNMTGIVCGDRCGTN